MCELRAAERALLASIVNKYQLGLSSSSLFIYLTVYKGSSLLNIVFCPVILHRSEFGSCDFFNPRLVVGHPHVHTWQIRISALDAMRHRACKDPCARILLDHKWPTAVTLE